MSSDDYLCFAVACFTVATVAAACIVAALAWPHHKP